MYDTHSSQSLCTQPTCNDNATSRNGAPATLTGFFHVPIDVPSRVNVYIILARNACAARTVCFSVFWVCVWAGLFGEVVTASYVLHSISTTTTQPHHGLLGHTLTRARSTKWHPTERHTETLSVCPFSTRVHARAVRVYMDVNLLTLYAGLKQTSKHEKITRVFRCCFECAGSRLMAVALCFRERGDGAHSPLPWLLVLVARGNFSSIFHPSLVVCAYVLCSTSTATAYIADILEQTQARLSFTIIKRCASAHGEPLHIHAYLS